MRAEGLSPESVDPKAPGQTEERLRGAAGKRSRGASSGPLLGPRPLLHGAPSPAEAPKPVAAEELKTQEEPGLVRAAAALPPRLWDSVCGAAVPQPWASFASHTNGKSTRLTSQFTHDQFTRKVLFVPQSPTRRAQRAFELCSRFASFSRPVPTLTARQPSGSTCGRGHCGVGTRPELSPP